MPLPLLSPSIHTTLAVIGGGQLGRMFCHAAQKMGFRTLVFTPDLDSPAAQTADAAIIAKYDDIAALDELAQRADAITIEFENIPIKSLEYLARKEIRLSPMPNAVAIAQNRILEKQMIQTLGLPTAPYLVIQDSQLNNVDQSFFPAILKTATLGYDGKGQTRVNNSVEMNQAFRAMGSAPCVCEKKLSLQHECSVILTRSVDGAIASYNVFENTHQNGILIKTLLQSHSQNPSLDEVLLSAAKKIANHLNYCGVLCVEFFILQDGSWVVNEIAPRPHNSGHITMDACLHDQFEQQVRALTGLPLASTQALCDGVMFNILGDLWPTQTDATPPWHHLLTRADSQLHLYGKSKALPGRKMGHLNIVNSDARILATQFSDIAQFLES